MKRQTYQMYRYMAQISLAYRVAATDNAVADLAAAKTGLAALTEEVLELINATTFKNKEGENIAVSYYVSEWDDGDEHDGVVTAIDSILLSGGKSALDYWEVTEEGDNLGVYCEELGEADWMPFRELILAFDNDLGKGIYVQLDEVEVRRNWHNGGFWFNDYHGSPEIRTEEEIERDKLVAQKRMEARRKEALKVQAEKEERRRNREPLIAKYNKIASTYSYAFKFVNGESAICQGIRINPTTTEATRFLESLNLKKTGGKFKYRFKSLEQLESTLQKFSQSVASV